MGEKSDLLRTVQEIKVWSYEPEWYMHEAEYFLENETYKIL